MPIKAKRLEEFRFTPELILFTFAKYLDVDLRDDLVITGVRVDKYDNMFIRVYYPDATSIPEAGEIPRREGTDMGKFIGKPE